MSAFIKQRHSLTERAREERGSMTLEAALVLPFFLAILVAMSLLIRSATVELALQDAVSDTVKDIAAHVYPVVLIVDGLEEGSAGSKVLDGLRQLQSARQQIEHWEREAEAAADYIPDAVLDVVLWERELREQGEAALMEPVYRSLASWVWRYADQQVLIRDRLKVVDLVLPDLLDREEVYVGIQAEYELRLPIPFFPVTMPIRKWGYERVWIGN